MNSISFRVRASVVQYMLAQRRDLLGHLSKSKTCTFPTTKIQDVCCLSFYAFSYFLKCW